MFQKSKLVKALVWALCFTLLFAGCTKDSAVYVGFYNVENLFDTVDNPDKIDEQFLPGGDYRWDDEKYQNKLRNLAQAITALTNNGAPDVLGLCEVENEQVLQDLIKQENMPVKNYKIVHYESPDARGIDAALLYSTDRFELVASENLKVDLSEYGETTRDILWVTLKPVGSGAPIHFFVNHWPSRREGKDASEPKRVKAAQVLRSKMDRLRAENPEVQIIAMGDFNDEPYDKSIRETMSSVKDFGSTKSDEVYNPMCKLKDEGLGSYNFRGNWNMLDQMMLSASLVHGKSLDYKPESATIFSPAWLRQHGGKYDQYPHRNFGGRKYLNGYSDHFPVVIELIYVP